MPITAPASPEIPGTPASFDAGHYYATSRGVAGLPVSSADASGGVAITDAPESGKKLVIVDLLISVGVAMSVTLKEETSNTVIRGPIYLAANTVLQITLRGKTKLPVADKKLKLFTSGAGNVSAEAVYFSEA